MRVSERASHLFNSQALPVRWKLGSGLTLCALFLLAPCGLPSSGVAPTEAAEVRESSDNEGAGDGPEKEDDK